MPGELPRMEAAVPAEQVGTGLKWIVDQGNPLTGRVIVNRAWQLHFGTGIVKRPRILAARANGPRIQSCSIRLSAELIPRHRDVKRLHRTIVT